MTDMPLVQIHGINKVSLDRVSKPVAGDDDVIVQVANCGICGSDLGYIAMGGLLGPGTPMPLGHELSGTVVAAGVNVSHVKLGDHVVLNPEGNGNRIGNSGTEGGFAPFLLVKGAAIDLDTVTALPDNIDFELGALIEPLSVSMHAVHQGRGVKGDRAVIFGAGPIGLGIVIVLRHYGLDNIIVVDKAPQRLAMAEQLGAKVINVDQSDLSEQLIKYHDSADIMGMPVPASDLYFEATGVSSVFKQITQLAKTGARIVIVGVHKAPVQVDLVNLLFRELTLTGSMAYPNEFPQVIDMLSSGKVDPRPLISHRFKLSEFDNALATATAGDAAIKVLVDCQG